MGKRCCVTQKKNLSNVTKMLCKEKITTQWYYTTYFHYHISFYHYTTSYVDYTLMHKILTQHPHYSGLAQGRAATSKIEK